MSYLVKILIGLAIFTVLIVRGGFAIMGPLLRFALPAMAVYFVYQYIKKNLKLSSGAKQQSFKMPETIKICPNCGVEMKDGHKCS